MAGVTLRTLGSPLSHEADFSSFLRWAQMGSWPLPVIKDINMNKIEWLIPQIDNLQRDLETYNPVL